MNRLVVIAMTLGLGTGALAYADEKGGLFVEPGVTYQAYESTIHWPAPFSDSTGKVEGFGILGRLGFHINEVFFVAADARYSQPHFKDSSVNYDASAAQFDLGPTVGVQMPTLLGLRVWGTYVATSQLDPKSSHNLDLKFSDGKGYRIGAGIKLAIVSLNLEYQKVDYGKTNIEALGPFTVGTTDRVKYNGEGWVASVSFPLEL